jgi:FHS family L-fucose permease-like MFS transporter
MNLSKMFKTEDGKNYVFTFALVSTLFLLWGICNGMIDVMDHHFWASARSAGWILVHSGNIYFFILGILAGSMCHCNGINSSRDGG